MTIPTDFALTEMPEPAARSVVRAWIQRRVVRGLLPLARNRLVVFAVIGGTLFALAPRPASPRDIDIRGDRLAALRSAEASRSGAPMLSPAQASEVNQRELEDEILYREGVRLGLDKNDGIVRQRVVQKVLFLAEEIGGGSKPATDAELAAFFASNRDRWARGEHLRLTQIYRHEPEALAEWVEGSHSTAPPSGEASPVAPEVAGDTSEIERLLGATFMDAIRSAPEGQWVGPVRSAFGWHLVRVEARTPARPAAFGEVKASVAESYALYRREEAIAKFLDDAFTRYDVRVDGEKLRAFTPSRRVAFRPVSSGED